MEPTFQIIVEQDNLSYFVYRTIEAIRAKEYVLACRLLLILIAKDYIGETTQIQPSLHGIPARPEDNRRKEERLKKVEKQNADRS
jgi:hypothetical protein